MSERLCAVRSACRGGRWFYIACPVAAVLLFLFSPVPSNRWLWLYLAAGALFLFAVRPGSALHSFTMERAGAAQALCSAVVAAVVIAACVLPMGSLPYWNGEDPAHRNQYELMTESVLNGRLDIPYGDEEGLLGLDNPYDPGERESSGVKRHWDHAFYNGHYYMYFGVVPVFLTFLPYRLLTGTALTTFHATQIFTAAAIAGMFTLFYLLAKRFFPKLSFSVYLALSAAFSAMSVWYATAEPALYCTAITAGIALEVWSLYWFIRAVWCEERENRQILFAGVGALLGALVFGCRPPIGLANLLVLPMLAEFLRQRKFTLRLLGKLVLAALPYLLVGLALMAYNYARFDDPFEFGQAYQLTVTDQSNYALRLDAAMFTRLINDSLANFFGLGQITLSFPYLRPGSVFFNFPILLLCVVGLRHSVIEEAKRRHLALLLAGFAAAVLVIGLADIMWAPYLVERYRMDFYFLLGIACFIVIGLWNNGSEEKLRARQSAGVTLLAGITLAASAMLCVATVANNYPEKVSQLAALLHLS